MNKKTLRAVALATVCAVAPFSAQAAGLTRAQCLEAADLADSIVGARFSGVPQSVMETVAAQAQSPWNLVSLRLIDAAYTLPDSLSAEQQAKLRPLMVKAVRENCIKDARR